MKETGGVGFVMSKPFVGHVQEEEVAEHCGGAEGVGGVLPYEELKFAGKVEEEIECFHLCFLATIVDGRR